MKEGYKQTEVGEIPDEWNVYPLGELLLAPPDYGINAPAVALDSRLLTYLRITDISVEGRFLQHARASVDHPMAPFYLLGDGEMVFARTGASVGKSYLYDSREGRLVFAGFLIRVRPDSEVLLAEFLKYSVQTATYLRWVVVNSMRSGQPGVNGRQYSTLPLSIPTLAEQQAIATALSDVDALIEALEQLIAKKRHIKQGAMQALLTGKRRLPGFEVRPGYKHTEVGEIPEDWLVAGVGEISLKVGSGVTPTGGASRYRTSGRPFVRSQNVGWGRLLLNALVFLDEATHAEFSATELCSGDVLLNITGASIELVGGNVNQHVCIIRVNSDFAEPGFVRWLFLSSLGQRKIADLQAGGSREGLNFGQIRSMRFGVPHTCSEQEAIATLLSDMDGELDALTTKRTKLRRIKQGMMRELLTGRIRLV